MCRLVFSVLCVDCFVERLVWLGFVRCLFGTSVWLGFEVVGARFDVCCGFLGWFLVVVCGIYSVCGALGSGLVLHWGFSVVVSSFGRFVWFGLVVGLIAVFGSCGWHVV